jgi:RecB family exonuclease
MFPIDNIKYYSGKYPGESLTRHRIQIYKTPEVIALLNRFMDSTSNKRLSASAINTYINCPLAFYMERVADIKIADPITDYIDESAFGSVVHRVVETIYNELANESGVKELTVTVSMLEALADDRARLDRHITRAVNEIYHHRAVADRDMSLEGEAKILGTTVMHMLRSLYRDEKQFAPFVFIAAEYKVVEPLDVMPGVDVNFSMTIDRIDKRNGNICLIDYKTGGDTLEFSSVDELFDASNEKRPKAIFQLMLYACAYSKYISYNGSIQPYIYQLKKLNINHLPPLMYQKAPFTDYLSLKDEFWHRFQQLIAELFNPDIPFEQTKNIHNCEYCKYAKICRG